MAWRACSSLPSALRRAATVRKRRPSLHSGEVRASGVHSSDLIPGKEKPLGITPMISPGPALTSIFWPTIVGSAANWRSEEHTSELQSHSDLVCRLLLEKKNKKIRNET